MADDPQTMNVDGDDQWEVSASEMTEKFKEMILPNRRISHEKLFVKK